MFVFQLSDETFVKTDIRFFSTTTNTFACCTVTCLKTFVGRRVLQTTYVNRSAVPLARRQHVTVPSWRYIQSLTVTAAADAEAMHAAVRRTITMM